MQCRELQWREDEIRLDTEAFNLWPHSDLSEAEREALNKLNIEIVDLMKKHNIKVVFPTGLEPLKSQLEADFTGIEESARKFMEDAQLWDDRIYGADEEFVETADVKLPRNLFAREETDGGKKIVVLGAGHGKICSTLTAALLAGVTTLYNDTWSPNHVERALFSDYNQTRLRKGKGHNRYKKGKKK